MPVDRAWLKAPLGAGSEYGAPPSDEEIDDLVALSNSPFSAAPESKAHPPPPPPDDDDDDDDLELPEMREVATSVKIS